MLYAGARYYMPALGRFTSTDRFKEKYPSLSPYQYAANNPTNIIDINGDSLYVRGTRDEVDFLLGGLGDSCGCELGTSETQDGDIISVLVTGSISQNGSFQGLQDALASLIGSESVFSMAVVPTTSQADAIEFSGNASYDIATRTIGVSQNWMTGDWRNSPGGNPPRYQAYDPGRAERGSGVAHSIMKLFGDDKTYSYKTTRPFTLGDVVGHELVHASDHAAGRLAGMTRTNAENRAINAINSIRVRQGRLRRLPNGW